MFSPQQDTAASRQNQRSAALTVSATEAQTRPALAEIAATVRRLDLPSPALYRQAGHERRVEIRTIIEGTEAVLHQVTRNQLAAAARVQALDQSPEPPSGTDFNYIDQIVGGKTNAPRASFGETLLTRQEIAEVEAKAEPHLTASARLPWLTLRMALQGACLALIAGVDVALLASTFSYLTDGAIFMTAVLSTAGLLVTAAFHLSSRDATEPSDAHKAIQLIYALSPWFILTWAVTAGVTVAATLYVTGGDSLFGTDIAIGLFGDPESAGPSLFERVGGLAFSISCGGLVLINMVLAHHLLTRIAANTREYSSIQAEVTIARESIEAIRACDETATTVLAGLHTELARLGTPDTCAELVVNDILAVIARERAAYETWLFDRASRTARTPRSRFVGVHDDLEPNAIHARVDALRRITFDEVYPEVCGTSHKAVKPTTTGVNHETVH